MTCIVGLIDKKTKTTYVGGDSLGSTSDLKIVRKDKKVFKIKNSCLGFTSSFRMGNILAYNNDLIQDGEKLTHKSMVVNFIPRLITLFSDNKYARLNNGEISGGKFLIAQYDRLFCVESDFQVGESNSLYHACGIGDSAALGSLYTTEKMDISPVDRIRLALQAATKLVPGVEPPFYIINTKNNDVVKFLN